MGVRKLLLVMSLLAWTVCAADAQTLRVTADRTNLRDKPSTDGAIIGSLVKGDELVVVERAGTWYRVRAKNGTEGYVSSLLVEVTAAAAATPLSPAPAPAAAPSPVAPPPAPAPVRLPPATTPLAAQPTPIQSGQKSDRTAFFRAMGGWLTASGESAFGAGVGAGLRPFGNDQVEIAVDGLIFRIDGESGLTGSGAVLYNFRLPDQSFTPYVGAGVTIAKGGGETDGGFHLAAGLEKPISDRYAIRFEARNVFVSRQNVLMLLAGLSF